MDELMLDGNAVAGLLQGRVRGVDLRQGAFATERRVTSALADARYVEAEAADALPRQSPRQFAVQPERTGAWQQARTGQYHDRSRR